MFKITKKRQILISLIILLTFFHLMACHSPSSEKKEVDQTFFKKGVNALSLEEFDQAIENFTAAIEEEPDNPEPYYLRGSAYYNRYKTAYDRNSIDANENDFRRAITDFTKAVELNPSYAEAYSFRGLTYAAFDDYENALTDYDKAILLKPILAEAYYQRALLFEQHGDKERAIADYTLFLQWSKDPGWRAEAVKRLESLQGIPLETEFTSDYLLLFGSLRNSKMHFFTLDISTGEEQQLSLSELENMRAGPAISLDGKQMLLANGLDTEAEIIIFDIDSGETTQITNNSALDWLPAWSPEETKIAFVTERDGNSEIYVMKPDGSDQTRLTNNPAIDSFPTWSPDSQHIVFASNRNGNSEIYVMKADGSEQIRLTHNMAEDYKPTWSPDGKHIAFISERDKNFEVYVMNTDGSNQTRMTNNTFREISVSWVVRR